MEIALRGPWVVLMSAADALAPISLCSQGLARLRWLSYATLAGVFNGMGF